MRLAAALFLLALAGCDSPVLKACDAAIQSRLKTPSTYKRVNAGDVSGTPTEFIWVEYDADNDFGAPLRSKGWCSFDRKASKASWTEAPRPG